MNRRILVVLLTLGLVGSALAQAHPKPGGALPNDLIAQLPRYPTGAQWRSCLEDLKAATDRAKRAEDAAAPALANHAAADSSTFSLLASSMRLAGAPPIANNIAALFGVFSLADDIRADLLIDSNQILKATAEGKLSSTQAQSLISDLDAASTQVYAATKTMNDLLVSQAVADGVYAQMLLLREPTLAAIAKPK